MKHTYHTTGTCCWQFDIEIENGIIKEIKPYDGCSGNLQGICALAKGMKASEVANKFSGIRCGNKPTSCPDQLSHALKEILDNDK